MRRATGLALLALLAACGDPPGRPTGGTAVVQLVTPNLQDGALLLRIGGEVSNVRAVGPGLDVTFSRQGAFTRVILTGDISAGDILEIDVPDPGQLETYVAVVEQAASRTDYTLFNTGPYRLVLRAR